MDIHKLLTRCRTRNAAIAEMEGLLERTENPKAQAQLLAALRHGRRMLAAEQVAIILLTDRLPCMQRDAARLYFARGRGAGALARSAGCAPEDVAGLIDRAWEALGAVSGAQVDAALPGWYLLELDAAGGQ